MDPRPICFTCWVCLGSSMRQPSAKDMPAWLFEENWKMYRIQRVQEDLRSQAKLTSACLSTSSHLCTLMPSQPSTFVTSEQKHCATGRDSVLVWLSYLALQIPNCGWTTEGFLNRKRPRLRMMIICLPWFNLQISPSANPPTRRSHQGTKVLMISNWRTRSRFSEVTPSTIWPSFERGWVTIDPFSADLGTVE